jgi:lipopolysaccharide export system protein LptA
MKPLRALALLAALPLAPAAFAADAAPPSTELRGDHLEMWTVNAETRAICTGAVTLTGTNLRILCDRLEITAEGVGDKAATIPTLDKFKYLLATGHVRIVQGDREATCGRAEVLPRDDKVVLTEEPVVIDHGAGVTSAGEKITLLRGQQRIEVDKPHATFPAIKDLGYDRNKVPSPGDTAPDAAPAPPK